MDFGYLGPFKRIARAPGDGRFCSRGKRRRNLPLLATQGTMVKENPKGAKVYLLLRRRCIIFWENYFTFKLFSMKPVGIGWIELCYGEYRDRARLMCGLCSATSALSGEQFQPKKSLKKSEANLNKIPSSAARRSLGLPVTFRVTLSMIPRGHGFWTDPIFPKPQSDSRDDWSWGGIIPRWIPTMIPPPAGRSGLRPKLPLFWARIRGLKTYLHQIFVSAGQK